MIDEKMEENERNLEKISSENRVLSHTSQETSLHLFIGEQ